MESQSLRAETKYGIMVCSLENRGPNLHVRTFISMAQKASLSACFGGCNFGFLLRISNALFSLTLLGHLCTKVIRGRSESKEMTSWTARLWAKTSLGYAETADKVRGENCRAGMNLGGYRYASFLVHNLMSHIKSVHAVASQ
jgi:hypothetical protein